MALDFSKPEKVENKNSFDGDPTGIGYVPQMSQEDANRWKAKRFNAGKYGDRIELRSSSPGSQVLVIVGMEGWNYKNESPHRAAGTWDRFNKLNGSHGKNVRISSNGPMSFSLKEWSDLNELILEAYQLMNDDRNNVGTFPLDEG